MPALGFFVAAAVWPYFSSSNALRWIVIAAFLPFVRVVDLRAIGPAAFWILIAWLAWAAIGLLWSPDPAGGAFELAHFALLAGVMIAAAGIDDIEDTIAAFGWGLVVALVASLFVPDRVGSAFLVETAGPIVAWAAVTRRWALLLPLALAVALGGSRIALAAAAAGLLFDRRWRWVAISALVFATVLFMRTGKMHSALERIFIWRVAAHDLSWLGSGLGSFDARHPIMEYAHSDLLQAWFEGGLLGLVLLAALGGFAFAGGRRRSDLAVAAALGVEIMVAFPLHLPASGFLAAVVAGGMARGRSGLLLCGLERRDPNLPFIPGEYAGQSGVMRGCGGSGAVAELRSPLADL